MRFFKNVSVLGNSICVREWSDETGPRNYKVQFSPKLFINCDSAKGTHRSIYGHPTQEIQFDTIKEAKDFIKQYENTKGIELGGQHNFVLQYISSAFDHDIKFDANKISAWSLDIETKLPTNDVGEITGFPDTATANAEITVISMQKISDGRMYVFASKPYPSKEKPGCTQYFNCGSERDLLKQFIQFWESEGVDVITGWNIERFDIPYIVNRCLSVVGEAVTKKLSPWGKVSTEEKFISNSFGGEKETIAKIMGVSILDYMAVYKKFTFGTHESYSLNAIAKEELDAEKLDHSEFKDFNDFYENGFKKYIDYNIRDTELVRNLELKLRLLDTIYHMSYMAKVNYNDVFGPVKTWDALIYNNLIAKGLTIPIKEVNDGDNRSIVGAYVKDPIPGLYDWVVSFDATSLYPSIMMSLNISPDTYQGRNTEYLLDISDVISGKRKLKPIGENSAISPIGSEFSREKKGFLPSMIEELMADRKATKRKMLDTEQLKENSTSSTEKTKLGDEIAALDSRQMAIKLLLNSLYGACANQWFRFYNTNVAESITLAGQYFLQTIEARVDATFNDMFKTKNEKYLMYIDTDSLYFNLGPVVKKFMQGKSKDEVAGLLAKLCTEKLQPAINDIVAFCANEMNVFENKIHFKLEVIGDRGLWLAKKKYSVRVFSSEGVVYSNPKLKNKGLELVKSSTPKFVREKLALLIELIFDTDESTVQNFLEDTRKEFFKLPINEIAFPRGVNSLNSYLGPGNRPVKGTPIHVRGSIVYNQLIKKLNLGTKYQLIPDTSKIRFTYLRVPNPYMSNVISFPVDATLPDEFGLTKYVDTYTQWEKTMIASSEILLRPIGWHTEKRTVLF